jgi:hypothetical protein
MNKDRFQNLVTAIIDAIDQPNAIDARDDDAVSIDATIQTSWHFN